MAAISQIAPALSQKPLFPLLSQIALPIPKSGKSLSLSLNVLFLLRSLSNNRRKLKKEENRSYGSIFKSHILGCPCVMMSNPEAAKFVLVSRAHLFKPTFPASKERMLGRHALFFQQGEYHSKLGRLVLGAVKPEAIRTLIPDVEAIALHSLRSWDDHSINTFQEMKTYAFNVSLLSIFGKDEILDREELKQCYYILEKGYNSMPIILPGTLFHKAMKARKQLAHILSQILASRRKSQEESKDLLGSLMAEKEGLTDEQIADNIIGVIFAARDTTASVLTWIVKYLGENPSFLQAVTEEQEAISRNKEKGLDLSWADTKNMPITSRVIQETMRIASILSFTFREAVEDVEYEVVRCLFKVEVTKRLRGPQCLHGCMIKAAHQFYP